MELLLHLFFIICHLYIPLHFVKMIFITCFTHCLEGASQKGITFVRDVCRFDGMLLNPRF